MCSLFPSESEGINYIASNRRFSVSRDALEPGIRITRRGDIGFRYYWTIFVEPIFDVTEMNDVDVKVNVVGVY